MLAWWLHSAERHELHVGSLKACGMSTTNPGHAATDCGSEPAGWAGKVRQMWMMSVKTGRLWRISRPFLTDKPGMPISPQ